MLAMSALCRATREVRVRRSARSMTGEGCGGGFGPRGTGRMCCQRLMEAADGGCDPAGSKQAGSLLCCVRAETISSAWTAPPAHLQAMGNKPMSQEAGEPSAAKACPPGSPKASPWPGAALGAGNSDPCPLGQPIPRLRQGEAAAAWLCDRPQVTPQELAAALLQEGKPHVGQLKAGRRGGPSGAIARAAHLRRSLLITVQGRFAPGAAPSELLFSSYARSSHLRAPQRTLASWVASRVSPGGLTLPSEESPRLSGALPKPCTGPRCYCRPHHPCGRTGAGAQGGLRRAGPRAERGRPGGRGAGGCWFPDGLRLRC